MENNETFEVIFVFNKNQQTKQQTTLPWVEQTFVFSYDLINLIVHTWPHLSVLFDLIWIIS